MVAAAYQTNYHNKLLRIWKNSFSNLTMPLIRIVMKWKLYWTKYAIIICLENKE